MRIVHWMNRHRVTSVLLALLVFFTIKPAINTVTHLPATNCGSINESSFFTTEARLRLELTEKQAALCFSQAHKQCHPATIDFNRHGVDTGSYGTLSTANLLGRCTLTLDTHAIGICFAGPLCLLNIFFSNEFTCSSLRLQSTELDLQNCGSWGTGPFLSWSDLP